MAYDVPLSTRITGPVHLRLRMLAALQNKAMSHVIDSLLDGALPSVGELAGLLGDSEHAPGTADDSPDTQAVAAKAALPQRKEPPRVQPRRLAHPERPAL